MRSWSSTSTRTPCCLCCVAHIARMIVRRDQIELIPLAIYNWGFHVGFSHLRGRQGTSFVSRSKGASQVHQLVNDAMLLSLRRTDRFCYLSRLLAMVRRGARRKDSGLRQICALRIDRDEIMLGCLEFAPWKTIILNCLNCRA